MAEMHLALQNEANAEDLPRTLRRAREAQEREAQQREAQQRETQEREARERGGAVRKGDPHDSPVREFVDPPVGPTSAFGPLEPEMRGAYREELTPASVRSLDIPFHRLVTFFLKAVIAAIPALTVLTAILWLGGQILKLAFPELLHAEILIRVPR